MSLGFIAVVLFFVASGIISYRNIQTLQGDSELVVRTHQIISALSDLLSVVTEAETGQRGFIITGKEAYLGPYHGALAKLDDRISDLARLSEPGSAQQSRLPDMKAHIHTKMAELAESIEIRKTRGFEAARAFVDTDRGKNEMDALRSEVTVTQNEEEKIRNARLSEMAVAYNTAIASGILAGILGVVLSAAVALLARRAATVRNREEWLQSGQIGLSNAMFGEQRVEELGSNVLQFLAQYLDAQAGAFFVGSGGQFRRVAGYALPENATVPLTFSLGDGLLGQAAKDRKSYIVRDVPQGYIAIGSALGHSEPRQLAILPAAVDGVVYGVLEFGFLAPVGASTSELLDRVSGSVGVAIRTSIDRARMQDLLEETQRQGEELQAQSEELRVSNEELEEQGRALRESQSRLELQQAELEQTNAQLEHQTHQLETQRDDLTRSRAELEAQAKDLERTSRFKSDFLANMSHELRTPLNSSLILAKLLSDNREGNLTDEQIKYAQTIEAAGNDLLALISDILDLSKIEAGRMELRVETTRISDIVASLKGTFEQTAAQKSLEFSARIGADAPETIETDGQRLDQVLKNLLSNAFKFTESGQVSLVVSARGAQKVAFEVKDTGIGIGPDQQGIVFEAFRQADGTTNRKYGGTGLGLSISRELVQLLGGEITLESELGKGSTFTVTVPSSLVCPQTEPVSVAYEEPVAPRRPRGIQAPSLTAGLDDRKGLSPKGRLILIVEDDKPFARILYDLAHEHNFECIIAGTSEEALALAFEHLPSAVLLDIGLPDNSGLTVLDRLKHDDRTRHIPVHVVSANDYSHTAMSLGAAAYMLKPVKREDLVRAFEDMEARLSQSMRQVLIVEDDPVQLDSMRLLLGSRNVEAIGASSAAECLSLLQQTTFDCMVLDLSLPDASGFSLLETLSQEEGYSFPPVIVYTGRELSLDEEQRLRRYSKSIIVKGAKSPERLLDEVTLFLHQVVADLPPDKQKLLVKAKHRDADLEGRVILVVEDDVRNVFALTSILEPRGAIVEIARNGRESLEALRRTSEPGARSIELVLMDVMMPEMDGLTAMREIRKNTEWKKLPIIALTAKAMRNDQEECLAAGANDYVAKPLDVDKLVSLVRVWMPRE